MTPEPTLDELVTRCLAVGVRLDVPSSQLEAEAVWRGVDVTAVVRALLLGKLEEVGAR